MKQEITSQAYQIEKLKAELYGHRKARFGSKSESSDQLVLDLQDDQEIAAAADAQHTEHNAADAADEDAVSAKPPRAKRTHNRIPLPDHLDRQNEVLLPGEQCDDCGGSLRQIGEDVTEELASISGRFVVRRIIRPRMTCTCCEYPSCARAIFDPHSIGLDERIGGFDQLAHEGHDGDLGGFSGFAQRGVFGLQVRIEAHGDEGGHIERVAQGLSPAADEGFPLPLTRFPAVRDQSGQASGLFLRQRPDFGQEGEDRRRGDRAKTRDRTQDVTLTCRAFIGTDKLRNLAVQLGDLPLDQH